MAFLLAAMDIATSASALLVYTLLSACMFFVSLDKADYLCAVAAAVSVHILVLTWLTIVKTPQADISSETK